MLSEQHRFYNSQLASEVYTCMALLFSTRFASLTTQISLISLFAHKEFRICTYEYGIMRTTLNQIA